MENVMNLDLSSLPDNAIELKEILFSLFSAWDENEKKYQEKINYLEERIRLLQNEIFGRKTEKLIDPRFVHRNMKINTIDIEAPIQKAMLEKHLPKLMILTLLSISKTIGANCRSGNTRMPVMSHARCSILILPGLSRSTGHRYLSMRAL
jgi:hypothetical protein